MRLGGSNFEGEFTPPGAFPPFGEEENAHVLFNGLEMNIRPQMTPRPPESFPGWKFAFLDIEYHADTQSVWMNYAAHAPSHFPLRMFMEVVEVRESLLALFRSGFVQRWPIRYFVIASRRPAVFALGGDLKEFAESVRARDIDTLRAHAKICVDLMATLANGFGLPIITLSAVNGQCLGGGFEGALVTDYLIAEETAKLGLPEIAFNSFPGMGAITLLNRRVGAAVTEQLILSGAAYTGREMYEMGIVDVLAPHEGARGAAIAWMRKNDATRWTKLRSLVEARRRCFPVTLEELNDIVEVWVDCVYALSDKDLRHMDRLVSAQNRLSRPRSEDDG